MKALTQIVKVAAVSILIAFSALHAEVDSAESSPESSTSVESTKSQESKSGAFGFAKARWQTQGVLLAQK